MARIIVKPAAWAEMEGAYLKASANGTLPANPRQIMYAARPAILAGTGAPKLDDENFTQKLLPDFMTAFPDLTASWNIVWDHRGHFNEPHTGHEIGLGTKAVRKYITDMSALEIWPVEISDPWVWTRGPAGRYGAALYVEKEGFAPILAAAGIAEEFDLAVMSSKGMSVTAARQLVEELCGRRGLPLFVLHDFDISGFSIAKTLVTSNRRYTFAHKVDWHDLGLRLADVRGLPAEPVNLSRKRKQALAERLQINDASGAEIDFLLLPQNGEDDTGQRVELNVMTSDQFVDFVRAKLRLHGVSKVVPGAAALAETYAALARGAMARQALVNEMARLNALEITIPADLEERVRDRLAEEPHETWDAAVKTVFEEDEAA